ncbi:hypothetical protein PR048_024141 [Dryococelus australis]|uniref:DDE Tnp4 domain-containing protein n=1 Tax=Dryococelus australis TaxID=614101 RepID=A0ABQ9GW56_9NEOP|nr:hypothetical protein PR048_024141 [Dryococelus australis]
MFSRKARNASVLRDIEAAIALLLEEEADNELVNGYRRKLSFLDIPVLNLSELDTLHSISSNMLNFAIQPPDQDALKRASVGFHRKWTHPNCCGSIDEIHVRIIRPEHSGSSFYNYKDFFFSMVLLALVHNNYNFPAFGVGYYGKKRVMQGFLLDQH